MKQIRITTADGDSVNLLAKGAIPQMIDGELTCSLHNGETLRVPIGSVLGYVVEDARKPGKIDALKAEFEKLDEAALAACERIFAAARAGETQEDEAFGLALADYCTARENRHDALQAIADQQKAMARTKAYGEKRKAAKANGTAPAPKAKKPATKKAKKA